MIEHIFFLVWEPNSGYTRTQHETESDAVMEAKRLARANRNKRFYVLKAITYLEAQDVHETMLMEPKDPSDYQGGWWRQKARAE